MAEKKRPSVAEILAAARKQGSGGAGEGAAPVEKPAEEPTAATPPAQSPAAKPAEPKQPAAAKPAAKTGGARPSVAEMMALARGQKAAGADQPAAAAPAESPTAKPAPKPAPAAKAPAGPAAKAAKPAAEAAAKPAASGVKDTGSILAAARAASKPGPITKAEAAKKAGEVVVSKSTTKLVVPPMPTKPDYAKPKPPAAKTEERRGVLAMLFGSFLAIGFSALSATAGLWTLGLARFMFPNILTEPPSKFKVGFPADFPPGVVEEKFKALFGVWVVNTEYQGQREIVALRTVCTHLGCTPNWLEGEQKFKCPCHGSGFYKDGINFEGPAPRPLERYAIRLADDGQLEVDKSKLFQEELGQWVDPACFVAV